MEIDYSIEKSIQIAKQHKLLPLIILITDYWQQNPPTLGHGVFHILRVASVGYQLAKLQNYESPEDIYIIGLFHDIYRPAKGEAGKEDQTQGKDIATKLLKGKVSEESFEKVLSVYKSHENWLNFDELSKSDVIFFTADKMALDVRMSDAYAWASNHYLESIGKEKAFKVPLDTFRAYSHYHLRHTDLFYKLRPLGYEQVMLATMAVFEAVIKAHKEGWDSEKYLQHFEKQAKLETIDEIKTMRQLGLSDEEIKKIGRDFYKTEELLEK